MELNTEHDIILLPTPRCFMLVQVWMPPALPDAGWGLDIEGSQNPPARQIFRHV